MGKTLVLLCMVGMLWLNGCARNPVTGENQLAILPESYEIEMGQEQYAPSRQMQGGDYLLDPELTGYVQSVGQRLAAVSDRKLPYEFVVLNNSTPNAWAIPGGKIAVNRGLLTELQSEAELAAVLSHEIVHAAARHGAQSYERGLLLQGVVLATAVASGGYDFSSLVVGAAEIGGGLINQRYSREAELEADEYGIVYMIRAGYDPQAAVDLQKTFVRLSESKESNWLSGLFASHPPSPERVVKNEETVARLAPVGGEVGRERYQEKISHLKEVQPAYAAYEKGVKALDKGDTLTAYEMARTALGIAPDESRFQCLLGDTLAARGDRNGAVNAYERAVALDPTYFRNYYQRGKLWAELGNRQKARMDLEHSLELLPTADGHYALGQLAMTEGNQYQAVKLFKKAARSRSEAGKAALHALHLYDLTDHPDRYLETRVDRKSGNIRVTVINPTTVTVTNLRVRVARSSKKFFEFDISQTLKPGDRYRVQTDVSVPKKKDIYKWRATVENARVVN